jgi:hypothetical protein
VRRQVTSQPVRRRGAPGPLELRRLRSGGFRMALGTRAVIGFREVSTGRRLRRCAVLDHLVGNMAQIACRVMKLRSNRRTTRPRDMGDSER